MARRFWQLLAAVSPTSGLKKFFLRRSGARIGSHVRIRRGSYVFANTISIGDGVILEPDVHIVCDRLEMGTECKVDSETVVYGEGSLLMGDGSYIGPRAWINCAARIQLGRHTGVGPGSMIFTHGVWLPYLEGHPRKFEDVVLGDQVWVPANVTILPGVTIGNNAIIGAGAVVTKDVPPGTFAAGVPAKPVGEVATMRAPSTPEHLDIRAREMLEDFAQYAAKRHWSLQRGTPPNLYLFSTKGAPRTALLYYQGVVTEAVVGEAQRLRGKARRMIVASLGGIDGSAHSVLLQVEWIDWFDFASTRARRSWDRDTVAFRRFLGSHWGTRFHLGEGH